MIIMFKKILTSHVGSFPLEHSYGNVVKAFKDMVRIGIDMPPFPQMRSFIDMYLKPLEDAGLVRVRKQKYFANEEVFVEAKIPDVEIEEATIVSKIAKEMKVQNLRAPITGPFTLASRIYLTEGGLSATAMARKELVLSFFKNYVKSVVKKIISLGYVFIVIDDPMLANVVGKRVILYGYSADDIIGLYNEIFNEAKDKLTGIHVCGRLSPKLAEILCEIERLKVLNHEFKDTRENMNVFTKEMLEKHDKVLSPGIVSSKNLRVESFKETYELLKNILNMFGNRVGVVTADCGFKALKTPEITYEEAYATALRKLKIIVEVVHRVNKELKQQ
mgnify:CR=1 FL=1